MLNEIAITIAAPRQDTVTLLRQANAILELKRKFKRDVHYGPPYPGSKKDTLLKPGAELLARRFGLRPQYDALKELLQINPTNLVESVILYVYRCQMIDVATGAVVGEAIGACSSLEDKYRFRTLKRSCPDCGQQKIMRSKYPDRKTGDIGWYCNACKHNFVSDEARIIDQPEDVTGINPNPVNELNTIIKMAQKRAFVSAVLVACGGSAYFAPGDDEVKDLYDTPTDDGEAMEAEWEEVDNSPPPDEFPTDEKDKNPPGLKPDDDFQHRKVAEAFFTYWRGESLTDPDVMTALGLKPDGSIKEWTKGRAEADKQVRIWLAEQLASKPAAPDPLARPAKRDAAQPG